MLTVTQARDRDPGPHINDVYGYFFSDQWGWIIGIVVCVAYIAGTLGAGARRAAGTGSRSATRSR